MLLFSEVHCNTTIEFQCKTMCIPLSWKCDEEIDCPGGEDENMCQCKLVALEVKNVSHISFTGRCL